MSFEDFCQYFKMLSVCRVVNTSFFTMQKTWVEAIMHGEWTAPDRQGGCMNNKETFLKNPQVSVTARTHLSISKCIKLNCSTAMTSFVNYTLIVLIFNGFV